MGLDPAGDDALGQVTRVVLQLLHTARLEHAHVVVVDRGGLGRHLLLRHGLQQVGVPDSTDPLFPQLRAVLAQVGHELRQQLVLLAPVLFRRDCRNRDLGLILVHGHPS